jgi:hypothetical protein
LLVFNLLLLTFVASQLPVKQAGQQATAGHCWIWLTEAQ